MSKMACTWVPGRPWLFSPKVVGSPGKTSFSGCLWKVTGAVTPHIVAAKGPQEI